MLALRSGFGRKFSFPSRDHHAREAIAEHVDGGAPHVHQLIDREEQKQRLGRQMKRSRCRENNHERRARHTRRPFTAYQKSQEHDGLLPDSQMNAGGLRDKKQRKRLVQAGAIQIEAVARGKHERDRLARHAERFHLFHRARQRCFRARRGKRDGHRLRGGAQESLYGNARQQTDWKQNASDEKNESDVHRREQLQERKQHSQSQVSDGVRNRAKNTDRRRKHHQIRELEHRLGEALRERKHLPALRFGHQGQRHRKQNTEDDDLQHLAFGDRLRDVLRKNIRDQLRRSVRRHVQRFRRRGRRQPHAFSRAAQIDRGKSDQQRDRGNNFEIDERLDAQPPDFLQIRMPGDAHYQSPEEQRRDDHLDQPQKNRAQELQLQRDGRRIVPQFRACQQPHQNPAGERTPRRSIHRDQNNREPAQQCRGRRRQRHNLRARQQRSRNRNRSSNDGRGK